MQQIEVGLVATKSALKLLNIAFLFRVKAIYNANGNIDDLWRDVVEAHRRV